MSKKQPTGWRPAVRTGLAYERLQQCTACGAYSVLPAEKCAACGAEGRRLPLRELTQGIRRRHVQRDMLILTALSLIGLLVAQTWTDAASTLVGFAVLAAAYLWLIRRYADALEHRTTEEMLRREDRDIRQGLLYDTESAVSDMKAELYQRAYEQLREIGCLLDTNEIKVLKLICLNQFILRSDMELELSTVVPDGFEPEFVSYFAEAVKVHPELVHRDALSYLTRHRTEVEALPKGTEALTLAAGAALRVQGYLGPYQSLIADYADVLPRDRLLRLWRMLQGKSNTYPELYARTQAAVKQKYEADPEFQGLA